MVKYVDNQIWHKNVSLKHKQYNIFLHFIIIL